MEDRIIKISDYFRSHDLSNLCDEISISRVNENMILINIEWGDWKHEHGRCDYLMTLLGYDCVDVIITEENGSDCYSAIRCYEKTEVGDIWDGLKGLISDKVIFDEPIVLDSCYRDNNISVQSIDSDLIANIGCDEVFLPAVIIYEDDIYTLEDVVKDIVE